MKALLSLKPLYCIAAKDKENAQELVNTVIMLHLLLSLWPLGRKDKGKALDDRAGCLVIMEL